MKIGESFNPHRLFVGLFIPNSIARCKDLSQTAKLCLGRLFQFAGHDGEAYPSMEVLSEGIGISKRQCVRAVKELEEYGLIRVIRPEGKDRILNKPSRYLFLWHSIYESEVNPSHVPSGGDIFDTSEVTFMTPQR